jgi:hypothetical protein
LIVGSYLQRGAILTINARLLDVRTGKLAPGGSANVSGNQDDLLGLADRLARYLHKNLTGSDLAPEEATPADPAPPSAVKTVDLSAPRGTFEFLKTQRIASANATPNSLVLERDLDRLVKWAVTQFPKQDSAPFALTRLDAPVTRLRVLAALVKVALPPDGVTRHRFVSDYALTPDATRIPLWGKPYLAAAIEDQWWSASVPLQAIQGANWQFVCKLLEKMPLDELRPAPKPIPPRRSVKREGAEAPDPDAYTGLTLDAMGLSIERAMSPRIVDEDGNQVYPLKIEYSYDDLLERGLVSYCETERQTRRRAGERPLCIRALDVLGSSNSDLVVSREDAERIRSANRRGKFLERWAVCFLSHAQ